MMNSKSTLALLYSIAVLGLCFQKCLAAAATTTTTTDHETPESSSVPLFSQYQYEQQQPNIYDHPNYYQWNQGGGMMMEGGDYGTGNGDAAGYLDKSWKRFTEVKNCVEEIFEAFGSREKINLSWECCSVVSTVGPGCFAETIGSFDDDGFSDSIKEHCANQVAPPPISTRL